MEVGKDRDRDQRSLVTMTFGEKSFEREGNEGRERDKEGKG